MIHIHNGDVVAQLAKRADIPGDHVAFRESFVTGPVTPGDDWIETRARTLSDAFGEDLLRVRTALVEQEQLLDNAASRDEVVLWFEHDLFCLTLLLYLLDRLGTAKLTLVWCPTPLSQYEERDLFLRFESRGAVTPMMLKAARSAWRAFTAPEPDELNAIISRDSADFPFLREGLTLHASRFPSTQNGLGIIEQRILSILSNGAMDFVSLFPQVDTDPPRFGFGDAQVMVMLRDLASRAVPLIAMAGSAPKTIFSLTPAGLNVLAGEVDDCAINDPDAWLGGVHLTKENLWRWNGASLSRA
ncbi:MAG TPA: hypothetical protein VKB93_07190 [Thermoanaerobaculia bacterium]|nr:hypothetical protein [Thermoanaerobaculia bacterium]